MSEKKKEKEVKKGKQYRPTQKQLKYLQVFISTKHISSNKDLANKVGISVKTIWKWKQNDGFNEWFNNEWRKFAHADLPKIYNALLRMARNGNVQAMRVFLIRFDPEYTERRSSKHTIRNIKFDQEASDRAKQMAEESLKKIGDNGH